MASDKQMRQALLWRSAARIRLLVAQEALEEARAGCPSSVERVRIDKTLNELAGALAECESNIAIAQRRLGEIP